MLVFHVVETVMGGMIVFVGSFSLFLKEHLFISEAVLALMIGIGIGEQGLKLLAPLTQGQLLEASRFVISIQLMAVGLSLSRTFYAREWKSLVLILGPVTLTMWIVSSLLIYALFNHVFDFLDCLMMGVCITPTDPVLVGSILKGKFADLHIPHHIRNLLAAESGTNDGLVLPLFCLLLYVFQNPGDPIKVLVLWLSECLGKEILASCWVGVLYGYATKWIMKFSHSRRLYDRESFLIFFLALTIHITGIVKILGGNEFYSIFVAAITLGWDDTNSFFHGSETSLQDVIDMVLNLTFFTYLGASLPWEAYKQIGFGRLVALSSLILSIRRLPIVLSLCRFIPNLRNYKEAIFFGWFGPIGVGAIYYVALNPSSPEQFNSHVFPVVRCDYSCCQFRFSLLIMLLVLSFLFL